MARNHLDWGGAGLTPGEAADVVAGERHCAAVLLARAGNFVRLRRALGRERAEHLADAMAVRLASLLAPDRLTVAAQDMVELFFTGVASLDLETATATIVQLFAEPLAVGGQEVVIDIVLGGAVTDADDEAELRLIEEAEAALADAVRTGVASIRSVGDRSAQFEHEALSRDLVTAMRDGELLLHYQPKVHLRRRHVASVEALLRWQHPTRGLVSPADFIPLAEKNGDIVALTLWALRRVIDDQRVMADRGHDLTIFVNIAGVLLADENFVARACELVGNAGASIGFEITGIPIVRSQTSTALPRSESRLRSMITALVFHRSLT